MKTLLALILGALLATSAAAQTTPRPEDFAYRTVIDTNGAGPFHQLALPLAVYEGVTSAGLADLRVFNGQGEALPYALLRSESQTVSHQIESAAPFFPLPAPGKASPGANDISVTVRQSADGSLVSVRQQPGGQGGARRHGRGCGDRCQHDKGQYPLASSGHRGKYRAFPFLHD